jgi:hypothetical protein
LTSFKIVIEEGAEGLRIWIQNKGGLESSEAIEVVAKDSFV